MSVEERIANRASAVTPGTSTEHLTKARPDPTAISRLDHFFFARSVVRQRHHGSSYVIQHGGENRLGDLPPNISVVAKVVTQGR
jgi:hypothetical protein